MALLHMSATPAPEHEHKRTRAGTNTHTVGLPIWAPEVHLCSQCSLPECLRSSASAHLWGRLSPRVSPPCRTRASRAGGCPLLAAAAAAFACLGSPADAAKAAASARLS
eukprot:906856-Pelagomonas_calceolata.AAC.5